MSKETLPDIMQMLKSKNTATETARTAEDERRTMQQAADLVPCVLGPVGGPYKPCLFSGEANMFMPVFK